MGSALYAIEVPPRGGNTSFAHMDAAYAALDEDAQSRLMGLTCIHDASRNSAGALRRGFRDVSDARETVGARHSIVRTHPVTGIREFCARIRAFGISHVGPWRRISSDARSE